MGGEVGRKWVGVKTDLLAARKRGAEGSRLGMSGVSASKVTGIGSSGRRSGEE